MIAEAGRLERITVCTRPFRAAGPRMEAERIGDKLVVHNYGHGGSGWSLSWGSGAEVVLLALTGGVRDVAVVGCGALGLTAAISLQRAGARVTIYARDLPPDVRSSRATGSWTPDARVALRDAVDQTFATRWERWARTSFAEYQRSLTLPGEPVKIQPRYLVSDLPTDEALAQRCREDPVGFVHLESRIADLTPAPTDLSGAENPFGTTYCRRYMPFRFDITTYSQHLIHEFQTHGGSLQRAEFYSVRELLALRQEVIVNCTGYGARTLLGDESVIPVRGQLGWLPAQPEVQYSLQWENLNMVSRPDGVVVQFGAGGDGAGWQDSTEIPDRNEAEDAVRMLADLQNRMGQAPR